MQEAHEDGPRKLLLAGLSGDAASYRRFLEHVASSARVFFRRRLRSSGHAEVEDLVQETLLAVHTRIHTYRHDAPVMPWVYAIARYKLADFWRRQSLRSESLDVGEIEDSGAFAALTDAESTLDIESLLQRLSPKIAQAVRLIKIDGLSVQEVASRLGMSESLVKVSVHRGLRRMSDMVSKA